MAAGRRDGSDLVIQVRVQPRAACSEIAGLHGDRLRVRLQAPPIDGRANEALVRLLAATFDVVRSRIVIEHGLAGRDKRVRIRDAPAVAPQLAALLGCE
jgi:uncharacterized protein (TIGR00251 family)